MQWLVAEHGSLAAVALKLSQRERTKADTESIERALRRLRLRQHGEAGEYGTRLLRAFGVPRDADERVKWMGVYHSRFTDLPVPLCLDQLQVWNRPPISESRARIWLELGFATCALRRGELPEAERHLAQARLAPGPPLAARIELMLVEAFVASKKGAATGLEEIEPLLSGKELGVKERECLQARWLDQSAHEALHARAPDLERARALYERISADSPFAACKRESGLAYVGHRRGARAAARVHAEAAIREAGDGGFTRLRITHLGLLAHILGPKEGPPVRARALRAARHLEDAELVERLSRG